MKVKICANRTIEDAKMSLNAGADIIGILVGQEHASTDFVDEFKAKEICDFVNGRCDVSMVTHLKSADEIIRLTKFIGNNVIQLHSDIEETEVEKIKRELPIVELVRLIHLSKDGKICSNISNMKCVDYYLFDSFNLATNQVGGTGLAYNWIKAGEIIKTLNKPVFLAGGLNPDNVRTAISQSKPYGVDVNSGCKLNGRKNPDKVKAFVTNAKWQNIKTIIFDFDNTFYTAKYVDGWGDYLRKFIEKYLDNNENYKNIVDDSTNGLKMAEIMLKEKGSAKKFYDYQGDVIFELDLNGLEIINKKNIEKLSNYYKLYMVSNSHKKYLNYHLDKFKIKKEIFTEILDNEFKSKDLSKAIRYKEILKSEKIKPEEILVVGDSFESDLVPAKNLGMQIILVETAKETDEIILKLINNKKGKAYATKSKRI